MIANKKTATQSEAVAWLDEATTTDDVNALVQPYIDAAAVLSSFDLETLKPLTEVEVLSREEASIQLIDEGAKRCTVLATARRCARRALLIPNRPWTRCRWASTF